MTLPHHPVLLPGLRVLRRDDRHLQVGLDAPHRLVLPDVAEVRSLLERLRAGTGPLPTTPTARRALAELDEAGLLVEADALASALRAAPDRGTVAALFAAHGADAVRRVAARRAARVAVEAPPALRHPVVDLLRASGLTPVEDDPALLLLLETGPVARDRLDDAVRAGLPHLVVGAGCVGPLVLPGATACLRCVDAHQSAADPRRALLLEQVAATPPSLEPHDAVTTTLVAAWAVRDVLAFVDGDESVTWSATLTLGPTGAPRRTAYPRHPHCGCSWGEALGLPLEQVG
ncbi:MAG: hypothetical protein ACXVW1_07160 [Nocardioides sp.]